MNLGSFGMEKMLMEESFKVSKKLVFGNVLNIKPFTDWHRLVVEVEILGRDQVAKLFLFGIWEVITTGYITAVTVFVLESVVANTKERLEIFGMPEAKV